MLDTTLARLRILGRLEGLSYLLLLGLAMPLKYVWGVAIATKIVGWPHGVLFVAYCLAVLASARRCGLSSTAVLGLLIASLLPFGPFVAERRWLSDGAR